MPAISIPATGALRSSSAAASINAIASAAPPRDRPTDNCPDRPMS